MSLPFSLARGFCPNRTVDGLRFFWVVLALGVAHPVLAGADTPSVQVTITSEAEALAKGFENAFERLKGSTVFLSYERAGEKPVTLAGVRSVRAEGAVLLIVTDRGTALAIPARQVIGLTDERPGPL
jgi:hypothetical protein